MGAREAELTRDFFREYVDTHFKNPVNTIRVSASNTRAHNLRVCEACLTLLEHGIPFYTEVKLKCGLRPDIVAPTHTKMLIEVMHSENEQTFAALKDVKLPPELKDEVLMIKTNEPYHEKVIL